MPANGDSRRLIFTNSHTHFFTLFSLQLFSCCHYPAAILLICLLEIQYTVGSGFCWVNFRQLHVLMEAGADFMFVYYSSFCNSFPCLAAKSWWWLHYISEEALIIKVHKVGHWIWQKMIQQRTGRVSKVGIFFSEYNYTWKIKSLLFGWNAVY